MGDSTPAVAPDPLAPDRVESILAGVDGARVLVLGDMVLDEHVVGRATAIAREAPVPVIERDARLIVPGGATNVATNLQALGAEVLVAGVVGQDEMADLLRQQLESRGIHTAGMMHDATRATSVKLRIWAGGDRQRPQSMVARVDSVDRRPLDPEVAEQLTLYLEGALPGVRGLILSDYENGVVGGSVLNVATERARRHGVAVTVDAHGALDRFRGAALVTPNQPEAEAELGRDLDSVEAAQAGADELRRRLDAAVALITLGERGMVLATGEAGPVWLPASPGGAVADPTGAGDTVAAAMTGALLAGATPLESAQLAALAARVVVQRLGAAVATPNEILEEARRDAV